MNEYTYLLSMISVPLGTATVKSAPFTPLAYSCSPTDEKKFFFIFRAFGKRKTESQKEREREGGRVQDRARDRDK